MSPDPSATEGVLGNSHSMFLLALDAGGEPRWGDVFGSNEVPGLARQAHIAWSPQGIVIAAGWSTDIDFGTDPLPGSPGPDIVVAKFPPPP